MLCTQLGMMCVQNKGEYMNHWLIKLFFIACAFACPVLDLSACPTCVGRIEKNSAPFFSDEHNETMKMAPAEPANEQAPSEPTSESTDDTVKD